MNRENLNEAMMFVDLSLFLSADETKGLGCKLESCSPETPEIVMYVLSKTTLVVTVENVAVCPWWRHRA